MTTSTRRLKHQEHISAFCDMLRRENYVVLDTETTGISQAEIVQIAVVDPAGGTLLDTLVRPVERIPFGATMIHGIHNEDVADAPTYADLHDALLRLLGGRDVIAYNASFDRKMLHQSAEARGLPPTPWKEISAWHCAMEAYAALQADPFAGRSYRWYKLSVAAAHFNIQPENEHSALGDCRTTLRLCHAMLNVQH